LRRLWLVVASLALLTGCRRDQEKAAMRCLELGDWPRAQKLFTQLLDEDPADAQARVGLARALVQRASSLALTDRDEPTAWEEAVRELEIAQGFAPDTALHQSWARATYLWARSLATHGDTTASLGRLKELLRTEPRHLAARNLAGIMEFKRSRPRTARELFLQNIAVDSTDAPTLYNMGLLEWHEGDILMAHAWWLKALRHDPKDENTLWWLVQAEKRLGQ
jgi:tetratricopeptide (TPR) repeat protein